MYLSWKQEGKFAVDDIIQKMSIADYQPSSANDDQPTEKLKSIAQQFELNTANDLPTKPDDLAMIIVCSPVIAILPDPQQRSSHALLLSGITGDGTIESSFVHIIDPVDGGGTRKYQLTLDDFFVQLAGAVSSDGHTSGSGKLFFYSENEMKTTVTSVHFSSSSNSETTEETVDWEGKKS